MANSPFIIDVTADNYAEVMQASFKVPVLLDFWASWCQPCHALMPVLAKLADEYDGRFLLGKLNTEEEQEIAAQFGIRSIPTVKLFRDGQPVDEFMGALPEQSVREFLDRHLPRESDAQVAVAHQHLQSGDAAGAIELLNAARESDPENVRITVTLAEAQAIAGDIDAAGETLGELPPGEQDKPEVAALRSHLYFAAQVAEAPDEAELEAKLQADDEDNEARLQLAMRKVVGQDYDAAMELLLELMQKDRSFGDDAGRNTLVKVFEQLGDDPRVSTYRRRMANLLY
jgi:putative thioredoxin